MKTKIENISLEDISRKEAEGLIREIHKLVGADLYINKEYPEMLKLHKLLTGSFINETLNVHFVNNND